MSHKTQGLNQHMYHCMWFLIFTVNIIASKCITQWEKRSYLVCVPVVRGGVNPFSFVALQHLILT